MSIHIKYRTISAHVFTKNISLMYFSVNEMIKKRNLNTGVNANISLEPTSASQSNNNINNNIIINRREDGKEDIVITRDVTPEDVELECKLVDVSKLILETYAQILLNQDKALISNLVTKNSIIVPYDALTNIIKCCVNGSDVDIHVDEDVKCCATKVNPIRRISAVKIISDDKEIVTDFKTTYNREWNELVNRYHLCLKYCVI